ncbi:MAG TPA: hypothetical protein VFE57_02350 [Cyclobacteriaceae bacterium]|jgi:multidrug transporter EmrE-like cation transporter|nr:hypothetical protein [Cyclobacteriaceae bacterium]
MWILFLGLLILFEAIADVLAKEYQLHTSWLYFVAAISAYVIGNVFWLFSLRTGDTLTRGAIIFSVGSAMMAVLIGLVFFKEHITRLETLGIALGLIAVILLIWE